MRISTYELSLLQAQQRIHELIAQRQSLEETLAAIADWVGLMMPGCLVSIMRFDPHQKTLNLVPNTHFSQQFVQSMQNISVDRGIGTCGTAAFEHRLVVTEEISTDARWDGFHNLAAVEGLRACWSMPILTSDGELLGTFATYYQKPTYPSQFAKTCLARGAALALLALLHEREVHNHLVLSEWHQTMFDNHPDGVYTCDLKGEFQSCNATLERITGFKQEQLLGQNFNTFVQHEFRELTQESFFRARQGAPSTCESMGIHALGHAYDLEIRNFPVIIHGEIVGVYGICRDISARKQQEAELRLLKRGIDASPHGIVLIDASLENTPAVYTNPAFTQITGYTSEETLNRNLSFLRGPDTDLHVAEQITKALNEQQDVDVVILNYRKDGTPFWNKLLIRPVFNSHGDCTHFIEIQQDISGQRQQETQLTYQATHDVLTGLTNQIAFSEALDDTFQQSLKTPGMIAVMYLDLDDFKPINDGLGHKIGNEVLVVVANRLRKLTSSSNLIARLVGDEFAMLIKDRQNRQEIIDLANQILEALARPIKVTNTVVQISVSIGIASNDKPMQVSQELLQNAGLAMTKAKQQGCNTWQWYSGQRTDGTLFNVTMRQDIHTALQQEQFKLHYQPVIDARSGDVCNVEALVRWQHPVKGLISPGEFISFSEQTGQIVPLGRWIVHQACQEIAEMNARTGRCWSVAVNISSIQFHREGFLQEIQRALEISGLSPSLLELEVTESVLLRGAQNVIDVMQELRSMGVLVAIDDFGTGFSSLSYLCDLPIHKVKLDRSFVQKADSDRRTDAIVQGVITMAHHMDLVIVAEGIETPQQHKSLVDRQCDLLQGFLFAKPMPVENLDHIRANLISPGH